MILAIFAVACGEKKSSPKQKDAASARSETPELGADREELDKLLQIPYFDYVKNSDDPEEGVGVVFHDPAKSQPGYRLYTVHPLCMAELIDPTGKPAHAWQLLPGQHWANCTLLPNGDLLALGSDPMPDGGTHETGFMDELRYIVRMNWKGEVQWKRTIPAHHDIQPAPGGRFVTLTFKRRLIPAVHPTIETRDDQITVLDAEGQIVESVSLYDVILARPDLLALQPVAPHLFGGKEMTDLFHSNSVEWISRGELAGAHPIYGPNHVLVSSRNQDSIFVIDMEKKALVWAWGRGVIQAQHDAQVLPSGNILLFDNGAIRPWSRIVEMDPRTGNIIWEYKARPPTEFYSLSRGSAQRLTNGNTLIANSDSGMAFEVTPGGEKVWEFICPHKSADDQRASIVRIREVDAALVGNFLDADDPQ